MSNKKDMVDLNNIYATNFRFVNYNDITNDYEISECIILLEDTLKTRTINNDVFNEYLDVVTDEMALIDSEGDMYFPKKHSFKYAVNMISIPDLLEKTKKKKVSKYTEYIYNKIDQDFGNNNMISREALFDNIDNITYLEKYNLNIRNEIAKVRVR